MSTGLTLAAGVLAAAVVAVAFLGYAQAGPVLLLGAFGLC